jgi:thiamine biosynthesis protein ThiI
MVQRSGPKGANQVHTFLLRYGDLVLKSTPVRRRMVDRMIDNLKDALRRNGYKAHVRPSWARLFVTTKQPEQVAQLLTRLFGLRSFSTVIEHKYETIDDILDAAEEAFAPHIKGVRFAVRAKREKSIPISSQEVAIQLGARLVTHGGIVDLSHPDLPCHVEIREESVLLFSTKQPGPGGFPTGTETRSLALISGGFDSPVATWKMLRRGVACDFLFFELGGPTQRAAIYQHLYHLYTQWIFGYRPKLYVISGRPVLEALRQHVPEKYWNVMLKRIFYRVAEQFAYWRRHGSIITGEALAQVSSQTMANLRAIETDIAFPVFRPLIAEEKEDIIALSRAIGSYDISSQVKEYCAITGKNPSTSCTIEKVKAFEEALGGVDFTRQLAEQAETVRVEEIVPDHARYMEAMVDEVPTEAVWIDMREQAGPPLPQEALSLPMESLLASPEQLAMETSYLLLCDVGMLSAETATILREMGYNVSAFLGGITGLRRHLKQRAEASEPNDANTTETHPNEQHISL